MNAAQKPVSASLGARLGALSSVPDPQPQRPARPAQPRPAAEDKRLTAAPPPAEAEAGAAYSARLSITTTPAQVTQLRQGRLDDGIQATARIRAMIHLWHTDPEIAQRVNQAARDWQ